MPSHELLAAAAELMEAESLLRYLNTSYFCYVCAQVGQNVFCCSILVSLFLISLSILHNGQLVLIEQSVHVNSSSFNTL